MDIKQVIANAKAIQLAHNIPFDNALSIALTAELTSRLDRMWTLAYERS